MVKKNNIKIFQKKVIKNIQNIIKYQHPKILKSAKLFYNTYKNKGMVYIFGTGHSHMMAEEGHFRAGGFAPICPILCSSLMLHESANLSSTIERTEGVTSNLLKKYNITSKDVLLIFTNSGVNQAPLEAAYFAKKIKCKTIGVSSLEYAKRAPLSKYNKKLYEIVDIFIDNYGPAGDALVNVNDIFKVSPFSTIGGSFILNSIISEVAELAKNEKPFPFYVSANMPNAKKHNQKLYKKFKRKNPHI